ncbi:AAC(3) family N-acetyltransferase [Bacteriovoracaceae bacterium]|nr:AAC(3) family N-acetyltransferase [Bacteriovoracaceae bacterium]
MKLFKYEDEIISSESLYENLSPYINKGDTLCAEIDVMRFGSLYSTEIKKNQLLEEIFNVFIKLIGPEGHLIVPSFSYSWGSTNDHKVFDIKNTKGKVGVFPEYFRKRDDVIRTKDPMFSYLIWGKRKKYFADVGNNSFGVDSIFEKVHKDNAKLMSFGLPKFDPTFVHYIEELFDKNIKKIGYREITEFSGVFMDDGKESLEKHYCLMRPIGSNLIFSEKKLIVDLEKRKLLEKIIIGASMVCISDCQSVFDTSYEGMKNDIHFLVEEL